MKCTTNRLELLSLLGKLEMVAKGRHTLPVLGYILIKAEKNRLTAWTNNLEVILTGSIKARVAASGAICLPLSLLPLLKQGKAKDVSLARKGKKDIYKLDVEIGNIKSTLDCMSPEEYPPSDVPQKGKGVTIPHLVHSLDQVAYAVAKEEARPQLTGVYLNPVKGGMEMVAADGFRLGVTKVKAHGKLQEPVIIPIDGVKALQKYIKAPTTMRVEPGSRTKVSFTGDGISICVYAIMSTYPNYHQLIPTGGKLLKVNRDALRDAIRTCCPVKDINNQVRLRTSKGQLIVSNKEQTTKMQIPAQGFAKYAYEPRYLLDVLPLLDKMVEIRHKSPSSAGMIKHNGTIHLVMPKHVQW